MTSSPIDSLPAELLFRLRAGPLCVWRWIADRLTDQRSDRLFGISSSRAGTNDSELISPEFVRYQAVSYRDMREILNGLAISQHDVFLDFGCGLGRAVCLAATYRFSAVTGVEISPRLCELARRNLQAVQPKFRCPEVQVIQANAIEYEIPPNVSVVFFFNPFTGATLRKVLDNIDQSLHDSPRKLRILFYGTVSTEAFRKEAASQRSLRLQAETRLKTGARALTYTAGDSR